MQNIRRFRTHLVLWIALLSVGGGCKDSPTTPIIKECSGINVIGTTKEIAATPRQDENLEHLALFLSDGLTADEHLYQRIVADIEAIRATEPRVAHIQYLWEHDGKELFINVSDRNTHQQILAGRHAQWNCLAKYYNLLSSEDSSWEGSSRYDLRAKFEGIYDLEILADVFAQIQGFEFVAPNWSLTRLPGGVVDVEFSNIRVKPEGDIFYYMFVDACDMPPGAGAFSCVHDKSLYYLFSTTTPGEGHLLGIYETPPPDIPFGDFPE